MKLSCLVLGFNKVLVLLLCPLFLLGVLSSQQQHYYDGQLMFPLRFYPWKLVHADVIQLQQISITDTISSTPVKTPKTEPLPPRQADAADNDHRNGRSFHNLFRHWTRRCPDGLKK